MAKRVDGPTDAAGLRRTGYLAVTLLLIPIGLLVSTGAGLSAVAAVVGLGTAWSIQGAAFWFLAGGLARGEQVIGVWGAGMAARLGVGVALWALAWLVGLPAADVVIPYALALAAFLLLEAAWLAVVGRRRIVRSSSRRSEESTDHS